MATVPRLQPPSNELPIKIVGSNKFGINFKINAEQTYNMFITDGWLCSTPGYKKVLQLQINGKGRGTKTSQDGSFVISAIDNIVYKVTGPINALIYSKIFFIDTYFGQVTIAENLANQLGICDGQDVWIYNTVTGLAIKADLPISTRTGKRIVPGYIDYHDGYFLVPDLESGGWYLSAPSNGLNWNWGTSSLPVSAEIQTKPCTATAVLRAPGKGNLIYVFGTNVMEMWQDVAAQ